MHWQKLGRVFVPDGNLAWARSHAMVPTARLIAPDTIRVFYAALDENMVGSIGMLDLSAHDPLTITAQRDTPLLTAGEPGLFDDSGVNPSCFVDLPGSQQLYYFGWQRSDRIPYHIFAGTAEIQGLTGSLEAVQLKRLSRSPIIDRSQTEPFVRSATTIEKIGDTYVCFYVSAHAWTVVRDRPQPNYTIRSMVSPDGVTWPTEGEVVIGLDQEAEFGFGRPWLFRNADRYELYYSIRSRTEPYRIGYATSDDGKSWQRRDDLTGLDRAADGWDSEMICFPCVLNAGGKTYMFYNGNQHGRTGFGVAVRDT